MWAYKELGRLGTLICLACTVAVLGCGRVAYDVVPHTCAELYDLDPNASTGTYTLDGQTVHCEMEVLGGGWTRVANVHASQGCPGEWIQTTTGIGDACVRPNSPAGSSAAATFDSPIETYSEVMGFVRGLQFRSMDAFKVAAAGADGLLETYVDGVSIVAFDGQPLHVYTYAVGWSDTDNAQNSMCPCLGGQQPPAFVGDDFFCEAGTPGRGDALPDWATDDPLWDGDGTGSDCDTPGDPSRFHRDFGRPLRGTLLVRLMADQDSQNEDLGLTDLELYVR